MNVILVVSSVHNQSGAPADTVCPAKSAPKAVTRFVTVSAILVPTANSLLPSFVVAAVAV